MVQQAIVLKTKWKGDNVSKMKEHMMTCTDSKCKVCHSIDQQIIHLIKCMKAPIEALYKIDKTDYGVGFLDACDSIVRGIESYMMYNRKGE